MGAFQNVLKSLRTACGLTQDELSKKIGVSRSTIGMYEQGSREPDYATLEILADFFGVDVDYLIGRTDKTTAVPESVFAPYEREVLEKYRKLDPYDRGRVDQLIDDLLEKKTSRMEGDVNVG